MTFLKKYVTQVLLILAITNIIMFVYVYQNYQKKDYLVQHTHEVIDSFKDLLSALKDAETGQRGYLLTNRVWYLEPYYSGIKGTEEHLKKIKLLVTGNNGQQISFKKVENLIQQKLSELEQTIETSKYNKQESIRILNRDHGKKIMDEIRNYIEEHISVEKKLLAKRKKSFEVHNDIIISLFIIEFIFIFCLLIVINITMKKTQSLIRELDESLNIIDKHIIYSNTDAKGIITKTSSAFEQLSGYKKDELIGKEHNVVRHPDNTKDFFKKIWKTIKSGNSWQGIIKNKSKDGSTYYVMSTIDPQYDNEGNISGYISLRQDITQQKEQEAQLLKQSKMAQMGEMISMIAHQWRQPLGAIASTSIDLSTKIELETFDLEEAKGREECQTYFSDKLKNIDGFVQNLTTTIDDFRNFYNPNKEADISLIYETINKALDIIKTSLASDNIEIVEKYICYEKAKIYSNEIMQVILNIIKNAQDNFKEKMIKNPRISITCEDGEDGEDEVVVQICDNGGGIPENILPNIFDPYFSTKDEKNGTGLGLYMSKIIVEEHHNGSLLVKNCDDGVCFTIVLNKEM